MFCKKLKSPFKSLKASRLYPATSLFVCDFFLLGSQEDPKTNVLKPAVFRPFRPILPGCAEELRGQVEAIFEAMARGGGGDGLSLERQSSSVLGRLFKVASEL